MKSNTCRSVYTRSGWEVSESELALFRAFLEAKTVQEPGHQVPRLALQRAFGIYYECDLDSKIFCGVPFSILVEAAGLTVYRGDYPGSTEVVLGFRLIRGALSVPNKKPVVSTF